MALISGMTIITSLSLFHLTLAYFFFTNPDQIADQAIVFIIGEAMGMVFRFLSALQVSN
jgi:putative flippase GtrA